MRNNINKILFFLLLIIIILFFVLLNINKAKTIKTIDGSSMEPMLSQGEKINFIKNYYKIKKEEIKKEDVVLVKYAGSENGLVKIIKATDIDKIEIKDNFLFVNDEIIKNSVGKEYIFKDSELKVMSFFIKDNYLEKGKYLVFGDNINNSIDSRNFGAVDKAYILGKFLFK
jgi:signal peptidase I